MCQNKGDGCKDRQNGSVFPENLMMWRKLLVRMNGASHKSMCFSFPCKFTRTLSTQTLQKDYSATNKNASKENTG